MNAQCPTRILISSLVDANECPVSYTYPHFLSCGCLCHWTWTWRGFDYGIVPIQCVNSSNRIEFCEECPMLRILGNLSTRIQLVSPSIPITHWKNSQLEELPPGLSIVQLLPLKYESFPSKIPNPRRHILLSSSIFCRSLHAKWNSSMKSSYSPDISHFVSLNRPLSIFWWHSTYSQYHQTQILGYVQTFGSTCTAAFIDDTTNHLHISILVFLASIANFGRFCTPASLFCKFWKTFFLYSVFVTSMLQSSGLVLFSCVRVPRNGLPKLLEQSCSRPGTSQLSWFRVPRNGLPKLGELTFHSECSDPILLVIPGGFPWERAKTDFHLCFPATISRSWRTVCLFCHSPERFSRILRILPRNGQVSIRHKIHRSWLRLHRRRIVRKTFLGSFRHHNTLLSFWKKWLRENVERFMMWNRCKRLFHSSRVKLPLVHKSVIWFLMSTYLIWILGSKLIPLNNQSTATRCVPDICLMVGLLPFYDHLDNSFVVLKNVSTRFTMRRVCVHRNLLHIGQINMCGRHLLRFGCDLWSCYGLPWAGDHWVCITLCRTQDINHNVPQITSG